MRPITAPPYHDPKVSHPDLVRRSGIIPWYLPEVDGTGKVAQVAQTCYHPFTETPGNCFSITASPVLKITPVSRTFSNIIYEPHVWLEEVVFLLHTIRLKSYRVQRKKGANSFWFSFILVEFLRVFATLCLKWSPIYDVHSSLLERVQRRFLKNTFFTLNGAYPPRGCPQSLLLGEVGLQSLLDRRMKHSVILITYRRY
jgi:hypothetical protein